MSLQHIKKNRGDSIEVNESLISSVGARAAKDTWTAARNGVDAPGLHTGLHQ